METRPCVTPTRLCLSIVLLVFAFANLLNRTDAIWVGAECCEFAVDPRCRTSCVNIRSIDGITHNCSTKLETEFWDCISRQRSKNRCCKRHDGASSDCVNQCKSSFKTSNGPTIKLIGDMKEGQCPLEMVSCMNSYRKKLKSNQSNYCCRKTSDEACRKSCLEIYQDNTDAADIADQLTKACGAPILYQPFWACLMSGSQEDQHREVAAHDQLMITDSMDSSLGQEGHESSYQGGAPFVEQLQCCHKAYSENCRSECIQLYPSVNPDKERWKVFEKVCRNSPQEHEMRQCLAETQVPCRVGCDNLEFCTNFNNRPTELFRSCSRDNDMKAKMLYQSWKANGKIEISSFANIPFKRVSECQPDKWKAIACTINIQPCKSGEFNICKQDCVDLLENCIDYSALHQQKIDIQAICSKLTVSSSNCIHLSTYTKPANLMTSSHAAYVRPCNLSTCAKNEVCLVNRGANVRNCKNCKKHVCVPGCPLSPGSEVLIPHGHLVRLPMGSSQKSCFRSAVCDAQSTSATGSSSASDMSFRSSQIRYFQSGETCDLDKQQKSCIVDGFVKLHTQIFEVDCNICACFHGNLICSKRKCKPDQASACGNCASVLAKPCGNEDGSCYDCQQFCRSRDSTTHVTCHSNPCRHHERCVNSPRVCLTLDLDDKCPQYECIPRHKRCAKLLTNAILQHEGNFFQNPLHRYKKYENIMSSSLFFSNLRVITKSSYICDVTGTTHDDVCSLVVDHKPDAATSSNMLRHNPIRHRGKCQERCIGSTKSPQQVCGYDQVTYDNECAAVSSGTVVQHKGPCLDMNANCTNVECTQQDCGGMQITLPGSCCSVCGGMFQVLFSRNTMRSFTQQKQQQKAWKGPVTVNDVIIQLRRFVDIYECQLTGYLGVDDVINIVITPHVTSSKVLVRACSSEAERISSLINQHNPRMTSDLVLSSLVASKLHPSLSFNTLNGGGAITSPSLVALTTALLATTLLLT